MNHSGPRELPPFDVTGVRLRLLIVEDRPLDAELLARALERASFSLTWTRVETEAGFRAALERRPDLILADYSLPQFDAECALDILQASGLRIPFILVSGAIGEEKAIDLMKRGMDDFLLKDRLARLGMAVTQALRNEYTRRNRQMMEAEQKRLVHDLRERVKEMTALHHVARLLGNDALTDDDVLQSIADLLPPSLQHSAIAAARLRFKGRTFASEGFRETGWTLSSRFGSSGTGEGTIELAYLERPPAMEDEPFLDEERALLATVTEMMQDWVDRRHGESALKRAQEELQSLVQELEAERFRLAEAQSVANIGTWQTDAHSLQVVWSAEAYRIFEQDPESFRPTHESFLGLVHPDDRQAVDAAFRRSLQEETTFGIEHRIVVDGSRSKTIEERWRAFRDQSGATTHVIGTCRDITAARNAERALRSLNEELERRVQERTEELLETGRRHETLLRNLRGMAYRYRQNRDRTAEFISEGCRDLLEIRPGELMGGPTRYSDMIHAEDRARFEATIETALAARTIIQHEYRLVMPNGRVKWVWDQARGIEGPTGEVEAVEGFVTDITRRKLSEIRERCQSRLFELLANDAPLEHCLTQIASGLQQEDPFARCEISLDQGPQRPSSTGRGHATPPGHACGSEAKSLPKCAGSRRERVHWSEKILSPVGELLGVLHIESPENRVRNEADAERAEWAIGLAQLAIAHSHAKQALTEREAFNRATLDTLSAHIAIVDSAGRIVTTNQAWRHFAADNDSDWKAVSEGANYLAVCDRSAQDECEDAADIADALRRLLTGDLGEFAHEYPCHRAGEQRWFLLRARPVTINDKRHALLVHENVTDMKRTEEELRAALEYAEHANRAKSAFLMTMSHELRTPLNGILGMNELLQTTQLDARQREYVEASETSGQHLLQLINDVLDLSKIEAGKLELHPGPCNLHELLNSLVATYAPLAREKGLALDYRLAQQLPEVVRSDRHRLQQILINLIGNALKFTPAGRIRISIDAGEHDRPGSDAATLRFTVEDTGIGIPEERRDRLFKAFSQVDSSTSRRYGGTGLGLSICRELVDLMGGTIGVDSEIDVGSTFWFEIPLERYEPEADGTCVASPRIIPTGPEPALPAPESRTSDARPHVLVAEDNHVNQVLICEILKRLGCTCDLARDGLEALEATRDTDYALLLMDCQMPSMDGLEATRIIRRRESEENPDRHVPIIAMTAHAMESDRQICLRAGMDDYVSKPIDFRAFERLMGRYLGITTPETG